ncbi:MAG: hypothetical protein IIZ97_06140 [Prevotella sp.]|nr:hypothetical protein [Prevotella sp.]
MKSPFPPAGEFLLWQATRSRGEDYSRYEVRGTLGENSIEGPDSNLVPRTSHLAPRDNSNLAPPHPAPSMKKGIS